MWVSWCGSLDLMVMGGDSCSKDREFESRHRILDEHFFTYLFVVKFLWKDENKWKRGRVGPFKKRVGFFTLPRSNIHSVNWLNIPTILNICLWKEVSMNCLYKPVSISSTVLLILLCPKSAPAKNAKFFKIQTQKIKKCFLSFRRSCCMELKVNYFKL